MFEILAQIVIGILWIVGGVVLSYVTMMFLPIGAIFYGAGIYGVIKVFLGIINIFRYLAFRTRLSMDNSRHRKVEDDLMKMFKRALVYVAASDDVIDADEIKFIKSVFKKITKITISKKSIDKEFSDLKRKGFAGDESFCNGEIELTEEMRRVIIHANLMLIVQDGRIEEAEIERFEEVMRYFNIPENEYIESIGIDGKS